MNWVRGWLSWFFKMKINCGLNELVLGNNPLCLETFLSLFETLLSWIHIVVCSEVWNWIVNWIFWSVLFLWDIPFAEFLFHFLKMLLSGHDILINSKIINFIVDRMFIELLSSLWGCSACLAFSWWACWDWFELDLSISFRLIIIW